MLALPATRQHLQQYPAITSPSFYSPLPPQPPQHLFDDKLLHDYLDSQQPSLPAAPASSAPEAFMPSAFDFTSPAIRIQQSTPTHQNYSHPPIMPNLVASGIESWSSYPTTQALQTPMETIRGHQRAASSSSIASSISPYQPAHAASFQSFPSHLPTPSQTPTQDSFVAAKHYPNFTPASTAGMDQTMAAHISMKQALMEQGDDAPDFGHSARQSVTSYDSPATPHTALGDDLELKMPAHDTRQPTVPKFERTFTDIAADNFYDPDTVAAQPAAQSKPVQSSLLSPYRNASNETVQRALQAAQYARSQSPSSSISRGDSPFRRGSPYRSTGSNYNSPMSSTAMSAHEQSASFALKSQVRNTQEVEPKTISPKDALLDYSATDEDPKMSLFPDGDAGEYDNPYQLASQSSVDSVSAQSYHDDAWSTSQYPANFTSAAPLLPQAASFGFTAPRSLPLTTPSQYRPTRTRLMEQTPEFSAHLTSMESSASEAEPPNRSQGSDLYLRKPGSTGAASGTYSCTYHGCSQRFESPQKLQKHKREGHRNANPGTAATMTSAAILERNSQAGPHKCDRINPTTGKSCSTAFSRPYDLTRHEDTIHNARKQKVRCALCVEEKTFSRNDALTRHMRVVHPEVDFPGKHRRRGENHD